MTKAKIIELKLGDVMPNPFRRVEEYALEDAKIESLRASIRDTEFWVGLTVMDCNGGHALLYGHHRLAAAVQELGPDYVHSFIDEGAVPDYVAIRKMASENSDAWAASVPHMTLSVSVARDTLDALLDKYPTWNEALGASEFGSPNNLRDWFGTDVPDGKGAPGPANYAQCLASGVGQSVIRHFLGGAFAKGKMVETGLRMAGPSAKQLAAAEREAAEAARREKKAAAALAAAKRAKAQKEERERLEAEAAEAKRRASEAEAKEKEKQIQKASFDASILPVDWNMAQCDAFQKGVTSPIAMEYGGVPIDTQRKLVALIGQSYAIASNGVDPRRKGKSNPAKLPSLTAKSISETIREYLRNGAAAFEKQKKEKIDPKVAQRAVLNGKIEKTLKAIKSASVSITQLEGLILEQKADVKGNMNVVSIVHEYQAMERVLDRLMQVIENPNKRPTKRKNDPRTVTEPVGQLTSQ